MQEKTGTVKIPLLNAAEGLAVFGPQDKYLRQVESGTNAEIRSRDAEIVIIGPERELASLEQLYTVLLQLVRGGYNPSERDIAYALELARDLQADELLDLFK